ncbi:hypothetical protein D6764_05695 [Candidatus Woesearchaeota archaeon]|nr:MAG: hypothetical protein D6764_05695 [Candidatus Woesearchaeota archaeon]
MDALFYLTHLSIILLIGLVCTLLSSRLKISSIFLLLIAGLLLSMIRYRGEQLISFPLPFLTSLAVLTLVIIVFDGSSRLSIKEFDKLSLSALRLTLIFLVLNVLFLPFAVHLLFSGVSILLSVVFAIAVSGTSPDAVLDILKDRSSHIINLLKIESILNTPITVLLPFIVLDFAHDLSLMDGSSSALDSVFSNIVPFLNQLIAGIGAGVLVGVIVFKIIRKISSDQFFPLVILTSALLTYVLAENLGGSGVLGVAVQGILFGSASSSENSFFRDFSHLFSTLLEILVFVLLGIVISFNFSLMFFLKSVALFALYLLLRLVSVQFAFGSSHSVFEKFFLVLNVPKGIALAVVTFALSTDSLVAGSEVLNLIVAFMLYSIFISILVSRYSSFFLNRREGQHQSVKPQKH